MKRWLVTVLALALAVPAAAGNLAGVMMSEKASVGDQTLVLNGMALRKKAIFKVYVAGLYLPAKTSEWQQVLAADAPRQLIMHWIRSVDKEPICEGWYDALEANLPDAPDEVKTQFDTLCGWMEGVRTGDRFVFTYAPESGTRVEVKGKEKGTLEGKPFADTLWSSWIGQKPGPGEAFRADLMGGS